MEDTNQPQERADESSTKETDKTEENSMIYVTFNPQEWMESDGEKRAVPTEGVDSVEFTVPEADATDATGQLFADDSRNSDQLKHHENAPNWVNEWDRPFTITTSGGSLE